MSQISENLEIVFFGGGNMGQALVGGLLDSGWPAGHITIVDIDAATCATLETLFPQCQVCPQAAPALDRAYTVVLAVKPQAMRVACKEIAAQCNAARPLIISIAAGTTIRDIGAWLGGRFPIVRCMPNTPALVRSGTTGLYASPEVSGAQQEIAQGIFASVGSTLWLEQEALLDAVTAVSGSGPAYFFYLVEAMLEAGQALGLNEAQARQLTVHTATGAAKLIEKSGKDPHELRLAVTSKGGTTEAAIETLERGDVKKTIRAAITRAAQKARHLAQPDTPAHTDPATSGQGE